MENELRGTLRNFGLKIGVVSPGHFEARIKELVAGPPPLEMIIAPLIFQHLKSRIILDFYDS
jgi:transposase